MAIKMRKTWMNISAWALVTVTAAAFTNAAHAAAVYEDFQGTPTPTKSSYEITSSPLFAFNNDREIDANAGRSGNYAWDTGNGAALGAGTLDTATDPDTYGSLTTITATTEFSMLVGLNTSGSNVITSNNGGAAGFGWTKATGSFSNYGGGGIGDYTGLISAADHFTIGMYKISGNPATPTPIVYGLSWANGVSQQMGGTNAFQAQSSGAELTIGTFYRLYGTVNFSYNAGTDKSTFTFTVAVDDWGDGSGLVTANVLTGSSSAVLDGFGNQGQFLWWGNASRGGGHLDNLYANAIPEPATLALMACGMSLIGFRRRRA